MTQEMWQDVLRRQDEAKKPSRWKKFREDYLTLEEGFLKGYLDFLWEAFRRDFTFFAIMSLIGYVLLLRSNLSTMNIYAIWITGFLIYGHLVVRPRMKKHIQERR